MSGCGFRFAVRRTRAARARVLHPVACTSRLLTIMAMKDAAPSEQEWIQIIRGEFLEIPGLRLTSDQVQKLWGLHRDACAAVLENLLHQRFLQLTADGHYVRAGSSAGVRQTTVKPATHHADVVSVLTQAAAATRTR